MRADVNAILVAWQGLTRRIVFETTGHLEGVGRRPPSAAEFRDFKSTHNLLFRSGRLRPARMH